MAERDEAVTHNKKKSNKKASKSQVKQPALTEILDAEVLDNTVVEQAGGKYQVEWALTGMDCPDCATKAMRALNHLDQVSNPEISAITGQVKLTTDLDKGLMSQVSSVLKSLGHPPTSPFYLLSGTNAKSIAHRNNIAVKDVKRLMMRQPTVLDVDISRDNEVLLQLIPTPNKELISLRDQCIKQVTGVQPKLTEARSTRLRPDQWRLFGGAVAVPILAIILLGELLEWSPILMGIIAAYGVLIGGLQMFHEALASLLSRQMGFQVLTSIAVIGASILGMWEEALMVVILVAIAAHLESSALENARDSMKVGLDRIPKTARRVLNPAIKLAKSVDIQEISFQPASESILPSNESRLKYDDTVTEKHEMISVELVNVGDVIEIRSGELIPADGKIIDGFGALDKSPLTGESVPIQVTVGDELNAGLILARGPVLVEVSAVGELTRLSGLIDTVHSFKEQKPAIQNQLEQFTAIWVPLVLVGALVVWYLMFPRDNWKIILLLWVVACPCALLLAAAMPHAAALSKASRMGAIVRGGETLERLSKVNHVMLDKTGTLTSGKPTLGAITIAKGRQKSAAIALAGGLEQRSSHPYAVTILEYLESNSIKPSVVAGITDIEAGVKGFYSGQEVTLIRADLAEEHGVSLTPEISAAILQAKEHGYGASLLTKDSAAIAVFSFIHDDTRETSKELIQKLLAKGIGVEIISGDQQSSVSAFAKSVGLPEQFALGSLSPEDKVQWVEDKSKSHVTMMVGDGFNDSAALAVADVGVAVGTGESVNLEAADIMFPGDNPKMLVDLHDLAVKMNRALIGNIFLSISITLILVIAVINQLYDELWVGVLIHEASVLLVIFNGARLAGRGSMLAMLMITMKTLWLDTKQVFIQMKEHYSKQESNTNLDQVNQNHATS